MASGKKILTPRRQFKRTRCIYCSKVENQGEEECFEIVGTRIRLHERRTKMQWSRLDKESRCFMITGRDNSNNNGVDGNIHSEVVLQEEYRFEITDRSEFEVEDELATEDDSAIGSRQESRNTASQTRLSKKKSPHITVSLPTMHRDMDEEVRDELQQQEIFREKMYMVCQQSPSGESKWHTTCVTFPDEAWKLERRRLSHRHSSFGSSISLSFARLDLACRTPDASLMSTPIDGNNFVFPRK